jgi:hypothetical protein
LPASGSCTVSPSVRFGRVPPYHVISQFRTLTGIGILYHYHRHFILQIGKAIFQIGNPALARLLALLQFLKLEFQLAYRGLRIIDFLFQTFQINPE